MALSSSKDCLFVRQLFKGVLIVFFSALDIGVYYISPITLSRTILID